MSESLKVVCPNYPFVERLNVRRASLVLIFVLSLAALPSHASRIHYDNKRDSTLRACDQLAEKGDADAATACFEKLLDASDLLVRAEAAHILRKVKLANRLFREAAESSSDPYIRTRWGYLYLTTHQISDAAALFRESIAQSPESVEARLGLVEAQGRQFQGQARQSLYDILAQHPDELHALILLARIELELQRLDEAERLLDAALEVAVTQEKSPLEIYALQASLDLLNGNPDSAATQKALKLNPAYGDIYAIPAYFYIITYRYREAVELYQRAIDIEPDFANGHSKLGINLLRTNNLFGARYHLEKAYALDPFNTETVNTLRLLDDMDDMRIAYADVEDPVTKKPLGRVVTRLDRDGVDALQPYVLSLSKQAVQLFSKRYDFKPKKPIIVELYHNHDDFGVRTVSTPGIGLLGVTFGYVMAMDSPKARASGDFHWGSTLWHELAHVFTLEAGNHLLPRWYSEGLSVYEEWHTGPLRNRELPLQVFRKLKENEFLPVADLDSGFVRPTYEGQVNVSYMQAGLICTYIAEQWGHQALIDMLKSFAEGASTADAIERHLKIDHETFDLDFNERMQQKYALLLANLEEWTGLPRLIGASLNREDWSTVNTLAERMIELYPDYTGDGNGYVYRARAQRELGNDYLAQELMLQWHARGGQDPAQLRLLARELAESDRTSESIDVLESINWVTPYQVDEHQLLGDHYLAQSDAESALREFEALIGSSDEYASNGWLGRARAYQLQGESDKALRSVLVALETAPFYREAQRLLLEIVTGESID